MKTSWLRGMLLGISVSLLLAGGVAVAQGLTVVVDQDCVECWPGPYDSLPADEYVVEITLNGWDPAGILCFNLYFNGEPVLDNGHPNCTPWPGSGPRSLTVAYPCESDRALSGVSGLDLRLSADGVEQYYGDWKFHAWQPGTDNADTVFWTFAEACEAEFVPEPGTIALLGSGLAGLAGYATLRWRASG
jgi:hypothetical protein